MRGDEPKMSFSSDIKQELNKNSNLIDKEMVKHELMGYFISGNASLVDKKQIRYVTESDYNINRFSKLLSNLEINHQIEMSGNLFVITLKTKEIPWLLIQDENIYLFPTREKRERYQKAIMRGAFLGARID